MELEEKSHVKKGAVIWLLWAAGEKRLTLHSSEIVLGKGK